MKPLVLHNTFTGTKAEFVPIKSGEVGLYVCGITPYDESHVGHARCYVVFDVLKRVLLRKGFKVRHIQNFTDVDDKIIASANKAGVDPLTYADRFIASFNESMKKLNILPADTYPRVTTHMKEIIDLIATLVKKGLAYELDGDVYYSVRKFPAYGQLSKRKLDELASGARVDVNEKKKDPLDFALWKTAKPGEPAWESPWGRGRPGWHIECSAMSIKYLTDTFDIHGGGLDLIFPHHENEIAQSVGATGAPFAKHWVHNGFVTVNEEKMSKSLGNFFTLKDIFAKFDPMTVRYFLLTQHYRGPLNFSDQEMSAKGKEWGRVQEAFKLAQSHSKSISPIESPVLDEFLDCLSNDLNTSGALGSVNKLCSMIFKGENGWDGLFKALRDMLEVLGLVVPMAESIPPEVADLLSQYTAARRQKDFKKSDAIRAQIKDLGSLVEDTPTGPRLKKI